MLKFFMEPSMTKNLFFFVRVYPNLKQSDKMHIRFMAREKKLLTSSPLSGTEKKGKEKNV